MAIKNEEAWKVLVKSRGRVGCKRSAPNRENAPPVKKRNPENTLPLKKRMKLLSEREQMEAHLSLSHQHQKNEEILEWGKPKNEATADKDLSVSAKEPWSMSVQYDINGGTHYSAEAGDSYLPDSQLQYNTSETHVSAEGGDSYLSDSCLQYNTNVTQFSAYGGDSYLSDSCLQYNTNVTLFSAEGGNSYLSDSCLQCNTNVTRFSAEGGDSYLADSCLQCNTNVTRFSAEGGDSYLADSCLQYNTNVTHFSADGGDSYLSDSCLQYNTSVTRFSNEGGDSYLPFLSPQRNTNGTQFSGKDDYSHLADLCPLYNTTEGRTKNEKASNAESMVDKWACSVCKAAAVKVVGFPCCHICPCWNCEFEMECCPICGVARTNGGEFHLPESRPQDNTNGNHISGGGDSHLPYLPQYNNIGTHDLAEGCDSNLPDSHAQDITPEGSTKNEEASEAESQVDRWACRVCKAAAVSVVVLPCRHLCLCWECISETHICPICGEAKIDCFFIRSV